MLANFFRRSTHEALATAANSSVAPAATHAAGAQVLALPAQADKTQLEAQFARIATQITLLWGYPEMDAFFNKLWIDDRGNRAGFPKTVMEDLMFLASLHQAAYPSQPTAPYANRGVDQDLYFRGR